MKSGVLVKQWQQTAAKWSLSIFFRINVLPTQNQCPDVHLKMKSLYWLNSLPLWILIQKTQCKLIQILYWRKKYRCGFKGFVWILRNNISNTTQIHKLICLLWIFDFILTDFTYGSVLVELRDFGAIHASLWLACVRAVSHWYLRSVFCRLYLRVITCESFNLII